MVGNWMNTKFSFITKLSSGENTREVNKILGIRSTDETEQKPQTNGYFTVLDDLLDLIEMP
jgi:hypothetical protein